MSNKVPPDKLFRVFEQAATGWVTIASLRESSEAKAETFCERQGLGTLVLGEQISKPPYILGNFPRIEIVFACVDKGEASSGGSDDRLTKLSKLKKLLDDGALTPSEFEREKAKLLSH